MFCPKCKTEEVSLTGTKESKRSFYIGSSHESKKEYYFCEKCKLVFIVETSKYN